MKLHMTGVLPNTDIQEAVRMGLAATNRANAHAIILATDEGDIAAAPGEAMVVGVRAESPYRPAVNVVVRKQPVYAGVDVGKDQAAAVYYLPYEKHPAVDDLLAGVDFVITSKDATP